MSSSLDRPSNRTDERMNAAERLRQSRDRHGTGLSEVSLAEANLPGADLEEALAPSAGPSKLHILVVDDDRDTAESTAAVLRGYGHWVQVALGGLAGLEMSEAE